MTNSESKIIKDKEGRKIGSEKIGSKEEVEYREKFFGSIPIYSKNKNSPDPKMKEVSEYAANIIADGFIRYSNLENDKEKNKAKAILDPVMNDVIKHEELVEKIKEKVKEANVEVMLGEYTEKYIKSSSKNNSKGKDIVR